MGAYKMFRLIAQTLIPLLLLPSISLGSKGDISIPLTVHEALRAGISGIDRKSEPVTVGIPFPKGVLNEKNGIPQLALAGAQDYQFRTLARWPDGSVRWALVDFQADCPAERMNKNVMVTRGSGNSSGKFLAKDRNDNILVDTGPLKVTIRKKRFNLFDSILIDGREVISPGISKGIVCVDGSDETYLGSTDPKANLIIEDNGPVRCVVKATGTHYAGSKRMMDYTVRMHFYKGKPGVRVIYSLRNASKKQFEHAFIRSLDLVTKLSMTTPFQVDMATHKGVIKRQLSRKDDQLIYYQAVSDFPQEYAGNSFYWHAPIPADPKKGRRRFSQEGYWIRTKDRELCTGKRNEYPDLAFFDISDVSGMGITVGIRFAAGWWPKSLRAKSDGTISVGLWPEENEVGYWIRYGSHNTFEIMYDFHSEPTNPIETMKKFQYPLIAKASVDWYNQNVYGIYPLYHFVSFSDEEKYVEDRGWEYKVGWRKPKMKIWRYYYWGWGGFVNQHDFARISLVNFLRETENPIRAGEYFLYSEARFNYNSDWAVYHSDDYTCTSCTKRGYGPQKSGNKADLSKVVFEIEHVHWYGLPLYYYMTGDERIKEAILDWGEIIKEWSGKPWLMVYQRFFGWEIYSLAAMYDFSGDPSFMKLADNIFERLLSARFDKKKPGRTMYIDWNRGFIMSGAKKLKPGLMTGYIVFDGLYNYYLHMHENQPLKERLADVLEGVSQFMYAEPYVEAVKKTFRGDHWAFWLPYIYDIDNKDKSDHGYRLILQAFYVNLSPYLLHGESKWLDRMDKIIRSAAWDKAGVWGSFGYMDHPGLQSILYQRLDPKKDTTPPASVEDLFAEVKGREVVLSWSARSDAARYQIKYATKKLVESLNYDPDKGTYKYDPGEYTNWWAGHNVHGEPKPRKPGDRQEFIIKGFKPGHYCFAIRSWDDENNRSGISNLAEVEVK